MLSAPNDDSLSYFNRFQRNISHTAIIYFQYNYHTSPIQLPKFYFCLKSADSCDDNLTWLATLPSTLPLAYIVLLDHN